VEREARDDRINTVSAVSEDGRRLRASSRRVHEPWSRLRIPPIPKRTVTDESRHGYRNAAKLAKKHCDDAAFVFAFASGGERSTIKAAGRQAERTDDSPRAMIRASTAATRRRGSMIASDAISAPASSEIASRARSRSRGRKCPCCASREETGAREARGGSEISLPPLEEAVPLRSPGGIDKGAGGGETLLSQSYAIWGGRGGVIARYSSELHRAAPG